MKPILYEILVPTIYGDTVKSIKTRHHKEWDKKVQKMTGGLTILSPAKGKWVYKGKEYPERVLPVRIMCTLDQMKDIVDMSIKHYRQKAVMWYQLSTEVFITYSNEEATKNQVHP